MSYKIGLRRHRLQTSLAHSRGLLGSWLDGDHQCIMTTRGDREAASDAPLQLQFIVVDALQDAMLAK